MFTNIIDGQPSALQFSTQTITHVQWPFKAAVYQTRSTTKRQRGSAHSAPKKLDWFHFDISKLKEMGYVPDRLFVGSRMSRTGFTSSSSSSAEEPADVDLQLLSHNNGLLSDLFQFSKDSNLFNVYVHPKVVTQRSHPELCLYNKREGCTLYDGEAVSGQALAEQRCSLIEALLCFHLSQTGRIMQNLQPHLLAGFFINYVCADDRHTIGPCCKSVGQEFAAVVDDDDDGNGEGDDDDDDEEVERIGHHANVALLDFREAKHDGTGIQVYCFEPHPYRSYHQDRRPPLEVLGLAEIYGVSTIRMIHGNQAKNELCAIYCHAFLTSVLEGAFPSDSCVSQVFMSTCHTYFYDQCHNLLAFHTCMHFTCSFTGVCPG